MKNYPFEKYRIYVDEKNAQVIAVSSYAGKTVKGRAKCDPRDNFDMEVGKKLAVARCRSKIAEKRAKRSVSELEKAELALSYALDRVEKMREYVRDSHVEAADAAAAVIDLIY